MGRLGVRIEVIRLLAQGASETAPVGHRGITIQQRAGKAARIDLICLSWRLMAPLLGASQAVLAPDRRPME
jgi:hypothetical protein